MKRVCILTGGSSGIGKATAELLAQNGYTVYELSRGGSDADHIRHITADVTDAPQIRAAVSQVLGEQGQIDLLVCNAGFGISGAVEFTDPSDAYAQLNVNFFGALHCIQAVLPSMRAQKKGHIVLVSSVAAPIAIPFQAFYSATKSATNALMFSLRNEVKPFGVKVCAVMPGDVKTGFTAARKKSLAGGDVYGSALEHAVAVMEHDEQNGMPPSLVAKAIVHAANEKNPRALRTVGAQYKIFVALAKFLPVSWTNALVGMIYK
ncbi:MAG: SDR family NAD(P)-dependent oxidoreductase [Eubacteriales bacterium]|nr:SDR family NAD(P)-dependent oxidoreductase [Eubacteriales bacterium]